METIFPMFAAQRTAERSAESIMNRGSLGDQQKTVLAAAISLKLRKQLLDWAFFVLQDWEAWLMREHNVRLVALRTAVSRDGALGTVKVDGAHGPLIAFEHADTISQAFINLAVGAYWNDLRWKEDQWPK